MDLVLEYMIEKALLSSPHSKHDRMRQGHNKSEQLLVKNSTD